MTKFSNNLKVWKLKIDHSLKIGYWKLKIGNLKYDTLLTPFEKEK